MTRPRCTSLIAKLAAYETTDSDEARCVVRLHELLTLSDGSFARDHFVPGHVTASAFIIDPARRSVLLHHHRRLGRWLQMGGHLDGEETPEEAALREGREESGLADLAFVLDTIFDIDIHPIPAGKGEPAHEHFDVRYLVQTHSPGDAVADPAESIDLRWFDLNGAIEVMAAGESTRAIRKIERILDRTRG